jgi:phosphatidylserine synthase
MMKVMMMIISTDDDGGGGGGDDDIYWWWWWYLLIMMMVMFTSIKLQYMSHKIPFPRTKNYKPDKRVHVKKIYILICYFFVLFDYDDNDDV